MSAAGHPTDRYGRMIPDGSWPAGRQATGELERLRRFLNTVNPESGGEHFGDGGDVRAWLVREDHGDVGPLTDADASRVRRLRGALRGAIADHDTTALDASFAEVHLRVRFSAGARLEPDGAGIDRFVGWIAGVVYDALASGTWARMKVCVNPHCGWVTFDRSKNGSSVWCSTKACGARAKARAYRARRKENDRGS